MKHRILIGNLALAVLLVGILAVSACGRHRTPEERADWLASKIVKELDLNDQQKIKLEAVKKEFLTARAEMRKEHEAMLDELLAQIQSEQLDQAKLLQLVGRHQAAQSRLAPQVLAKVAELHASLSPNQKAEAAEHLKRFRERMQRHDDNNKM